MNTILIILPFLFMRVLETALNKDISTERIKEALRSITLTGFNINGKEYYLKNKMDKVGKSLCILTGRLKKIKSRGNY